MLLTTTAKVNAVKKLFRAKQYDEALEIAEKINPEKVSSVYDLSTIAEVYMKKGRYQDAKDLYMEMYGRNKTHKVMTGLIEICLKLKEPREAEQYLREFRRMEPDNPERLVYRYRVDCMLGKEPEFLIKSLSKLKNEEYTDVWALELAKAYYKNNDREACAKECRQILQYFPDSEVAAKARVLFDACVTEEEPVAAPETPDESVDTTAMAESLMEDVSALLEENARAEAVANESLDEKSIAQATPAHSEPYLRTPEFLSLHQPAGEDRSLFGEIDLTEKAPESEESAAKEVASVSAAAEEVSEKVDEEEQAISAEVEETAQEEIAAAEGFAEEKFEAAEEVVGEAGATAAGIADSFEALRESYVLPEELEGKIDRVFFDDDDDDDDFDDEDFEDEYEDADDADSVTASGETVEDAGSDEDGEVEDEADEDEEDNEDDDDDELVVVGAYGGEEAGADEGAEESEEEEDAAESEEEDEPDEGSVNDESVDADGAEDGDDEETDDAAETEDAADDGEDDFDEEELDEFDDDDLDDLEALDGVDDDDFEDEFDDEDYDDLDEFDDDEDFDEEDSEEASDGENDDEDEADDDDDACDEENFPEEESGELSAEDVVFAPSDKADEELEAVAERLGNEVCNATAEVTGGETDDESDEKKMADTQVVPCVKEKPEIPDEDMEKMLFNLLKDIGGKESK